MEARLTALETKWDQVIPTLATKADLDRQSLVTKADLDRQSLVTKADIDRLRQSTKSEIKALKKFNKNKVKELQRDIQDLRGGIEQTLNAWSGKMARWALGLIASYFLVNAALTKINVDEVLQAITGRGVASAARPAVEVAPSAAAEAPLKPPLPAPRTRESPAGAGSGR